MSCFHPACPFPVVLGIVALRHDLCRTHLNVYREPYLFSQPGVNVEPSGAAGLGLSNAERNRLRSRQRASRLTGTQPVTETRVAKPRTKGQIKALVRERVWQGERSDLQPELL